MKHTYELNSPNNYSLEKTLLCHGWVFLDPFKYDSKSKELTFVLSSHSVSVMQDDAKILIQSTDILTDLSLRQIERVIATGETTKSLLSTSKRLSKGAYKLVQIGYGRMLKAPTLWEDLAKTLLTTNCNWRKTQSMVTNLCNSFGVHAHGRNSFPTPVDIIQATDEQLQRCGLGYRDRYLKALAVMCKNGELDFCENANVSTEKKIEVLRQIRGFGPYSVSHALVLLRDYSRIPIDSDSTEYLASLGFEKKVMPETYASWGKYRFWGYKLGRIARKLNWIGD